MSATAASHFAALALMTAGMTGIPVAADIPDAVPRLEQIAAIATPGKLHVAEETPAQSKAHHPATSPTPPHKAKSPPPQPAPAQPESLPINLDQALYLIRTTLLTLNDANRAGNYTVLRDLSAPGFQMKNSAADLAQIFADLRRRRVDLFAVALMAPQLSSAPSLDGNGMLRLTGFFPTQPLRIAFDLLFQNVDHNWRLFGISVLMQEVAPQANLPPAPPK